MDNNRIALSSLALDLARIALAYHRGSDKVAQRFIQEANKRKAEVNTDTIPDYINELLSKMHTTFSSANSDKKAEDCLMYSVLFQNYAVK